MHLCFSCISYLSFGTEIAGETKTQPRYILTNNNVVCYTAVFSVVKNGCVADKQQLARLIYRLHHFCRARIT